MFLGLRWYGLKSELISRKISGNDLVVTAAHCVDGASETRVILGSYNLAEEENGRIEISSQEIIIHPSWDLYTSTENDIALIKLSEQVEFSKYTMILY